MKHLVSTVPLLNRISGTFEDAELFHGVDGATLRSIDQHWEPMFAAAAGQNQPEDAHWDWAAKALYAQSDPLNYELFSVEADNKTQGMLMAVKGGPKTFSRHPDHPRRPLVYVDFLATAPWNRPGVTTAPVYKGVGRVLFTMAVSLSFDETFDGRIGLHSLPGAETFYRNTLTMTDLGEDPAYHDLRYFELSATQARQYVAGGP